MTPNRFFDRVLTLAAAGLVLATMAALVGAWAWWLDLFSHFRLHYVGAGAVLVVLSAWRRRVPLAGVAALVIAVNLAAVVPVLSLTTTVAASEAAQDALDRRLKVTAINVNYRNRNVDAVERLLRHEDPDIVVLAEVTPPWRPLFRRMVEAYPHQVDRAEPGLNGMVLLSKRPWVSTRVIREPFLGLQTVVGRVRAGDTIVQVIGIHVSHVLAPGGVDAQRHQTATIGQILATHAGPTVLMGDLNMTPWSHAWRRFVAANGFAAAPGFTVTWPQLIGPFGIPIDHVVGRGGARVAQSWKGPDMGSDHRPVIATVHVGG